MKSWFTRHVAPSKDLRIGPLEWRILELLWRRTEHASVRDLLPEFSDIAYTTIMTTLDRLYRKGVLARVKHGKAFYYTPQLTKPEFDSARAADALKVALAGDSASLTPLLSFFVDAVSERDDALLDELEALVKARRAGLED
jgi:predicted transcriptional regulator